MICRTTCEFESLRKKEQISCKNVTVIVYKSYRKEVNSHLYSEISSRISSEDSVLAILISK